MRRGARIRQERIDGLARHGDCPVARQPVVPVLETRVQGLLDQQPPDARAVEKQVPGDALAALHANRVDVAIAGAQLGADDLALGAPDTARFGISAQEQRVQSRIEMKSVGDVPERRLLHLRDAAHELALARRHRVDGIVLEPRNEPAGAHLEPVLVALEDAEILPDAAEAVDIEVPELCPVDELDAELEGALGSCEKLVLVELERGVVVLDGRDGRLADTDRGDLVRLDEADAYGALQELRKERRGHPARSSAPHDDDILDALIHRSAPRRPRSTSG